jgi:drug/metabolite transporter (DMT)-like permease
MRRTPGGLIAAGITIVVWASAFAVIRVALEGFSPTELTVVRLVTAAAVLLILAPMSGVRWPEKGDRLRLLFAGAIGMTAYQLLLNTGETVVEAGTASLLIATSPIWVAVLSQLFLGERLPRLGWLGIVVGFVGAAIIGVAGQTVEAQALALLILAAAIAQATYIVAVKPLLARYRPIEVATWAMVVGAVLVLPFGTGVVPALGHIELRPLLAAVYLGVVPSAIGFIAWGRALADAPASVVSSALYVIPPLAGLIAWAWLGERPDALAWIGGVIVLAGVSLVLRSDRPVAGTLGAGRED